MENKELIRKLKKLEKIEPSREWLDLTRNNLISQINWEKRTNIASENQVSGLFGWFRNFQPMALVVCLLMIFIGGPWLIVMASRVSLPGEILYSVKRASEGIQSRMVSKEKQSQLQIEFANRRLEEFSKITDSGEKDGKAKEVINDFKNNLADVNANLSGISREKALAVAKKTIKIKEDLTRAKEEASLDIQEDLIEAEQVIKEINSRILAVLTEEGEKDLETESTAAPDEEILIFLEKTDTGTITTTDKVINGIKELENKEE